jgi:hypothetical protein
MNNADGSAMRRWTGFPRQGYRAALGRRRQEVTTDRQERIRKRAHQIWIDEGKPFEQHERHWEQAIADINKEDAQGSGAHSVGSPAAEQVAGAGPALAEHSKDAAKPAGRKPKRADK